MADGRNGRSSSFDIAEDQDILKRIKKLKRKISKVNKLNQELKEDVKQLDDDKLEEYFDGMNEDNKIIKECNISISKVLKSITNSNPTNENMVKQQKERCSKTRTCRIPQKTRKPYWMTRGVYENCTSLADGYRDESCIGCGQVFTIPQKGQTHSLEFYIHMIEDCEDYKKLNLITECKECNYKFLDKHAYNCHESKVHSRKPVWMQPDLYSIRNSRSSLNLVKFPCLGCGKVLEKSLSESRTSKQDIAIGSYIHMIDDCDKYKQLGLIRKCKRCKCKFINHHAYNRHKCVQIMKRNSDAQINGKTSTRKN